MKKRLLPIKAFALVILLLAQFFWSSCAKAQQNSTLKGTVSGENNQPVSEVSVVVLNTQTKFTSGTKTDAAGVFTVNVPAGSYELTFSSVGYESQTLRSYSLKAGETATVNVSMKASAGNLDQVVVVGFATQRKVNLTGAVGVATAKDLESRPVTSTTQALQGLIPGLKITGNTGELDKTMDINVRGTGTIGSSSGAPLILIDGMEGNINTVNPQDVESISVLKDAAASSIYGSRAPFGVVLITTKSGKKGKISINYNNNARFSSPLHVPETMDSYTFAVMMDEASRNQGVTPYYDNETLQKMLDYQAGILKNGIDPVVLTNGTIDSTRYQDRWSRGYANTNIWKETYKSQVISQEHNLSASGGTDKISYYASFNYLNQGGLLKFGEDGLKRYNLTGKINATLTDWLKFSYSNRFTRNDVWRPRAFSGGFYDNFGRTNWPNIPIRTPDGFIYHDFPRSLEEGGTRDLQTDVQYHQGSFIIEPVKNWITNVQLNYRIRNEGLKESVLTDYNHDPRGNEVITNINTSLLESELRENYLNLNVFTEYSRSFASAHNFKILAGFQSEEMKQHSFSVRKYGLLSRDLIDLNLATGQAANGTTLESEVSGSTNEWATAGVFGRLNYDFKGRYLLEGNLRYDATSRFRKGSRSQLSPSVSAGWNIADEKFWTPLSKTVNQFKLRGSYGQLGNQNTNDWYPTYRNINLGLGGWLQNGARPNTGSAGSLVSTLLTWETVSSWNAGLDFGLLRNRLFGSFDYFIRYTKNMVGPAPELPNTLGIGTPQTNNTDLHTKGFELSLAWRDRLSNGLKYGINLNLSDQATIIDRYPGNRTNSIDNYIAGQKDGLIWGYETIGIAKSQEEMDKFLATLPNGGQTALGSQWSAGDIMYRDVNGDGKISAGSRTLDDHGDLVVLGDSYSHYFVGADITAEWKGFDFRCFFQGVLKRDFWPGTTGQFWGIRGGYSLFHSVGYKQHNDYFRETPIGLPGHEIPANLDSYFPRPIFSSNSNGNTFGAKNQFVQSRYMQNARYIRLKNWQLGYSLPVAGMKKVGISKCRIFISGENLLTFTPLFSVFDPETMTGGSGGNAYPLTRTWAAGVSLTF